eukprot:11205329-Lingulodinium_polyedra.AAC.1
MSDVLRGVEVPARLCLALVLVGELARAGVVVLAAHVVELLGTPDTIPVRGLAVLLEEVAGLGMLNHAGGGHQ